MEWHHSQSCIIGQGDQHCLLGVWRSDFCGCDAKTGDSHVWCLIKDAYRTQEAFHMSSVSQESNRKLASSWQCKAEHKFEDLRSHHKSLLHSFTPSIQQPWSSTLRFPPVWSPEGWTPCYGVWDWWWCDSHSKNLAAWAGQGIPWLVPSWCKGVEVDRLHEKIGYGVKPSLFIMCNLHDLGFGIYWKKKINKGHCFLGNPGSVKALAASLSMPCGFHFL